MLRTPQRRGFGTLGLVAVLALLVGGFVVFSTVRTLGEFMGSSGSSGGGHQAPPVPAAPLPSDTQLQRETRPAASGTSALRAADATCRELERRLLAAVESGSTTEVDRLRAALIEARGRLDALLEPGSP